MPGSKREQKRLEAAEHVTRCVRAAFSYHATREQHFSTALDWLLVWIANAPKAVQKIPIQEPRRTAKERQK